MTVKITNTYEVVAYGKVTNQNQPVHVEVKRNGELYDRYVLLSVEGIDGDYEVELSEEDLYVLMQTLKSPNIVDLSE